MNLKALTSKELELVLEGFDGMYRAYEILEAAQALTHDVEIDVSQFYDDITQELTSRALEDAGYKVNQMVGRGEVDRYMRPDGQVGYGPALGANQDADWEL